jgi:hypothetical protein
MKGLLRMIATGGAVLHMLLPMYHGHREHDEVTRCFKVRDEENRRRRSTGGAESTDVPSACTYPADRSRHATGREHKHHMAPTPTL